MFLSFFSLPSLSKNKYNLFLSFFKPLKDVFFYSEGVTQGGGRQGRGGKWIKEADTTQEPTGRIPEDGSEGGTQRTALSSKDGATRPDRRQVRRLLRHFKEIKLKSLTCPGRVAQLVRALS